MPWNRRITLLLIHLVLFSFGYHAQINGKSPTIIDSEIERIKKLIDSDKEQKKYSDLAKHTAYYATLLNRKANYEAAEKILTSTLQKNDTLLTHTSKAILYSELGNSYKLSGKDDKAFELYLLADKLLEHSDCNACKARNYVNAGELYRKLLMRAEALKYMRKAAAIISTLKTADTSLLIYYNGRKAAIINELVGGDSSTFYSFEAVRYSRLVGDKYSEAVSLNEIGLKLKNVLRKDSAMICLKHAEELWIQYGSINEAVLAKFNQALVLTHIDGSYNEANKVLYDALKILGNSKSFLLRANIYDRLSENYKVLQNKDSMNNYIILRLDVLLKNETEARVSDISKVKEKYENEKIKGEMQNISNKLTAKEEMLKIKNRENYIVYISLSALIILLMAIAVLAYKLYFSNRTLVKKFKEKETLVKEIHHRVKNNLQFVSSLINMQINSGSGHEEAYSLNDASRRIKAMALVHEMLYNQNEMEGILINKYLQELVGSMNELVNSKNIPINFDIHCEEHLFSTPRATAIGMITSELISNSIKYAFEKSNDPKIIIQLTKDNANFYRYTFVDNGIGLKKGQEVKKNLGMRLIDIFSRQLKGKYSINGEDGLIFNLEFDA